MERYNKVKDHVYGTYHKINNELLRTAAFLHTNSVDNCITPARHIPEPARRAGEDRGAAARFRPVRPKLPPQRPRPAVFAVRPPVFGAVRLVQDARNRRNRLYDRPAFLQNHIDSPMCELLKDADVLARFLEDPYQTFSGAKKERLLNACADLN